MVIFTDFVGTQVAGYAVGGGHVLHMVCDLTIAAENAVFGQTGPKVTQNFSFPIAMPSLNSNSGYCIILVFLSF